jgi:hypothetical protein
MKKAIGIVIFVLILPFIINIPDAKLREDAQKLIDAVHASNNPEIDNGYYALLGFEAPAGKDIFKAGTQAFIAYSNSQNSDPPRFEFSLQEIIGPPAEMPDRSRIPECIPEKEQACLGYYTEKKPQLERLLKDNTLLLERYDSLNKYAFFRDTTKPAPWAPWLRLEGSIFAGHLLTVANATILFNRGSPKEALRILNADIVLWRKLLAGASDLPGKTYAFFALRLNYSLLEEILGRISTDEASELISRDVLAAPSSKEISADVVWDRHFQALAWSLSNNCWPFKSGQEARMSFLDRCFTKSNATLNDAYEMFQLMKLLSTANPDKVENVRESFSNHLEEISKTSLSKLYNPLGKRFVSASFDDRAAFHWNQNIHSLDQLIHQIRSRMEY